MLYKILHGLSDLEMPTSAIRSTCANCMKFIQPPAQVDPYTNSAFFPDQYTFGIDCRLITLLLPLMILETYRYCTTLLSFTISNS